MSITMNRHKRQFLTDFYDGEIVVQQGIDKVRDLIKYVDTYHRLPIYVDGKTVILTPYKFCGHEYPYVFLFAGFHRRSFIQYIHEEQMPDELAKRMEKRKQMAKERGNSSSNEMLF